MGYSFKKLKHRVRTIFKSWFISWFSSRHRILAKSFLKAPFTTLWLSLSGFIVYKFTNPHHGFVCLFLFLLGSEELKQLYTRLKKMEGDGWPLCKLESRVSILLSFLRSHSSDLNPEKEAESGPWSTSLLASSLWHFPVLSFYWCWRASRLDLVLTTDHHSVIRLVTKTKQWN